MKTENTLNKNIKIAGWAYLLIIFTSILSLVFLSGQYTVLGDTAASIKNMSEYTVLVRLNVVYELFMFSAVILLSTTLFQILKQIDIVIARTAMLLRLCEAVFGFISVLCTLAILIILKGNSGTTMQIAALLYDIKDVIQKIIMFTISLGSILFFSLFLASKMIPKIISLWSITGFTLMLIASILYFLDVSIGNIINIVAAAIVIPFEFFIGLWLIIKGTKKGEEDVQ